MTLQTIDAPVYVTKERWESKIYDRYNQLVATVIGDIHHERACLLCHLINQHFKVEPSHYYPIPKGAGPQ